MNILGIECSGISAGAAVMCGDVLRSEGYMNIGLTHSETLMPLIDNVIKNANIPLEDIDVFAVSDGPGSFTGLRIGIGTAKGLAYGLGKKVCPVSPLLSLCYNVPLYDGIIAPIMDARHNEVYNALYKWENGNLTELAAPRAIDVCELAAQLPPYTLFIGDGALKYENIIKETAANPHFAPCHITFPRASSIAAAAKNMEYIEPAALKPFYLKKPQAERELLAKIKSKN